MRSSRVLAQHAEGMALAEVRYEAIQGDRRSMSLLPPVRRLRPPRCGPAPRVVETRFQPSRLEFSKEVSVGILKRMTLAISGLLLAGVAAFAMGAAPAAAASPASAGSHTVTLPAWCGSWSSCGCWDDWDDCGDDWCDECDW
jgi:hypothetical protein